MHRIRIMGLAVIALAAAALTWTEEPWHCVDVVDGDTLSLQRGPETAVVHLFGVDAPESDQRQGPEATAFLADLVHDRPVEIEVKSSHNTAMVGVVLADGRDVAELLCQGGLAWVAEEGDTKEIYAIRVIEARASDRGIWAEPDAEHPAAWLRARPTPKPTPKITTLADIAATTELKGTVISGIPSMIAKSREEQLFLDRAISITYQMRVLEKLKASYDQPCAESGGADPQPGGATKWSDEKQAWVDSEGDEPEFNCKELEKQYTEGVAALNKELAAAVAQARRFGVDKAFISEVLDLLELERSDW